MYKTICFGALAGAVLISSAANAGVCSARAHFAVVAHGGELSERMEGTARLAVMKTVLADARAKLAAGAASLDVVESVVRAFEDSGDFNAGRGAIADKAGIVETDASIMDGNGLRSGAVASMTAIKNPVVAARMVMEQSPHVLMAGDRGQDFVKSLGAQTVTRDYFENTGHPKPAPEHGAAKPEHGTVGAVALDRCGHIAAATSTGGYDAKIPGRVGDSPIVGAGVYANDDVAGFSATGHGEYFIRFSISKDVADRMKYGGQSMHDAMKADLKGELMKFKDGDGALIGIDKFGHVEMMWNAVGLFRGYATDTEAPVVAEYDGPTASRN